MQVVKAGKRLGSLTKIYCKWCGKVIPNATARKMFCDGKCQRLSMVYRVKVLTPPDAWVKCHYCTQWFPVWNYFEKYRDKSMKGKDRYCSMEHRAKGAMLGIPRTAKSQELSINKIWPIDEFINRSVNCFRKIGNSSVRCREYEGCGFKECTGFKENKTRELAHNEQIGYIL